MNPERHTDTAHRDPDTRTEAPGSSPGAGGPASEDQPRGGSPAEEVPRPRSGPESSSGGREADGAAGAELFPARDVERFRARWREVQGQFVDHPDTAVSGADALVAEVLDALNTRFAEHKRTLESQWSEAGEARTEELRQALRSYRFFFDQLLNGKA